MKTAHAFKPVMRHPDLYDLENGLSLRAVDAENRQATFVASTENGVLTWEGREYLRMSGVQLDRYRKNPVVLDAHDRWSAASIVGRASVKVEKRELIATITFAETDHAEEVWRLVKDGFLNALSVGFMRDATQTLKLGDGESDGKGATRITGPAVIVKRWTLYEISVVPVPADENAVRRSLGADLPEATRPSADGGQKRKEQCMDPDKNDGEQTPPKPAPAKPAEPARVDEVGEERALRAAKATAEHIRLIAGEEHRALGEACIREGVTLDVARERILQAAAAASKPAGTPEPKQPAGDGRGRAGAEPKDGGEPPVADGAPETRALKDIPAETILGSIGF